ncbi:MAG: hypothetical protein O3C40_01815 [Planctomycetota bacterium]|nr:hypothetical protein [Planctomycetota bacterium]
MKLVIHDRGIQSWALIRIVLALLVGLVIAATATGSPRSLGAYTVGDIERPSQVPVNAAVERADGDTTATPFGPVPDADADHPDSEASRYRIENPMPAPYDIWIDVRLLEAISRVA